jgi:SP family general alpha glucoside:H+ symporter-like MFS transporter
MADFDQINNFFGQGAFVRKFGTVHSSTGKLLVPADWQAGVNNAASGGQIIGLLINGWAQTKYGYRTVYMIGMAAMAACIFVLFFAENLTMILVGNLLAGIPWGIFQVCPKRCHTVSADPRSSLQPMHQKWSHLRSEE